MNFTHCLHIVLVIGKYSLQKFLWGIFPVEGRGGGTWEDLSIEEFFMGEENFLRKRSRTSQNYLKLKGSMTK